MNTSTGDIILVDDDNSEILKANFIKKIPDRFLPMLAGMNRKERREWYRKNKKSFSEVSHE